MRGNLINKTCIVITSLFLLAILALFLNDATLANAQGSLSLGIDNVDTNEFPLIRFTLNANDIDRDVFAELTANDVQVIENGLSIIPEEFVLVDAGVDINLAINESPYMANRSGDSTLYDEIIAHITQWINTKDNDAKDVFSFSTNTGLQAIRLDDPLAWRETLINYEVDLKNSQSSLISLAQALDLASDASDDENRKKSILYITSLPSPSDLIAIPNYADQAKQLGVSVFVWLVAQDQNIDIELIQPLRDMAENTDGKYFQFLETDVLPDLNSYFDPLGYYYAIAYKSLISQSGYQVITVSINSEETQMMSDPASFDIVLLPPNPIFLDPPVEVYRTRQKDPDDNGEILSPDKIRIKSIIEFPDGYDRDIISSRLIIDDTGELINDSSPFEQFEWDLSPYIESGAHTIRIKVEDEQGLIGETIDTLVNIEVEEPAPKFFGELISGKRIFIGIVIIIMLSLMAAAFIASLKRPRGLFDVISETVNRKPETKSGSDANSLEIEKDLDQKEKTAVTLSDKWGMAQARLVKVEFYDIFKELGVIYLYKVENKFGRDEKEVDHLLEQKTADPVHALIIQQDEGRFLIKDAGSGLGTWINHNRIVDDVYYLRHGDLIFMGLEAFRFELKDPVDIPKLIIQPYNEDN